jgi:hypothetical protein
MTLLDHLKQKWEDHIVALGYHDYDRALCLIDDLQAYAPDGYFDRIIRDIEFQKIRDESKCEEFWQQLKKDLKL